MPSRDDDIETMPEDDLLTIPSGNVPPGLLTVLGFIAKIGLLRPEDDLGGSDLRR